MKKMPNKPQNTALFTKAVNLLQEAREKVVRTVNLTMVQGYFEIGRMIVEEEQGGKERADYGKELLKGLSKVLTKEFGRGFSVDNLENMRRFFLAYENSETLSRISAVNISETASRELESSKSQTVSDQLENTQNEIAQTSSSESDKEVNSSTALRKLAENEKQQTLSDEFTLSWSHYLKLMRIDDENERRFYEIEASKNNWSARELDRQYNSALYTRLVLSRDKEEVKELSEKGLVLEKPKDAIKDPYVLEFLGLPEKSAYSESDLEQGLIDKLEHFLLELGTGFNLCCQTKTHFV